MAKRSQLRSRMADGASAEGVVKAADTQEELYLVSGAVASDSFFFQKENIIIDKTKILTGCLKQEMYSNF